MRRLTGAAALIILCIVGLSARPQHEAGAKSAATAATARANPKLQSLKKEVAADIDSRAVALQQMIDQVFSFGELGFQEFETSKY
jgi:aminobenzoyl-glutamate utilization protein B